MRVVVCFVFSCYVKLLLATVAHKPHHPDNTHGAKTHKRSRQAYQTQILLPLLLPGCTNMGYIVNEAAQHTLFFAAATSCLLLGEGNDLSFLTL